MKTIVIVDDEPNLRMLARITLDDPEYRILEAEDGSTALALARSEKPDLLVLDWMMPGLTGIEVAHTLRQDAQTPTRGQGFPPELARYLFRPFTITIPLHHSRGTGLSLALASAIIVETYGGTIQAASPGPGQGASFIVELPTASGLAPSVVE